MALNSLFSLIVEMVIIPFSIVVDLKKLLEQHMVNLIKVLRS